MKLLYKPQQPVIKLFNDYSSNASEVNHKVKYGERLKTLSTNQTLQRLPIALAQVKAGTT